MLLQALLWLTNCWVQSLTWFESNMAGGEASLAWRASAASATPSYRRHVHRQRLYPGPAMQNGSGPKYRGVVSHLFAVGSITRGLTPSIRPSHERACFDPHSIQCSNVVPMHGPRQPVLG